RCAGVEGCQAITECAYGVRWQSEAATPLLNGESPSQFFRHCANAGFRPRVVQEVGGYPTNMLGLISVGVGLSVLPHFAQVERINGIIWRKLTKPKLWWDFSLVWKRSPTSMVVEQFVAAAEKQFPSVTETSRADI